MVDLDTRAAGRADKSARSAALWATAVAVPIAVLAGLLVFSRFSSAGGTAAQPTPTATAAQVVPAAPVPMAAPRLDAATTKVCLAVTSQLPTQLRNLPGRTVSAGPEQNAAWGEPPIRLACGVPQPAMCERADGGKPGCVPLTTELLIMNGVCWWGDDGPATKVFTTMDREVAVQVSVPAGYAQPAQWANEFSDAVVKAVTSKTAGVPSGCTG